VSELLIPHSEKIFLSKEKFSQRRSRVEFLKDPHLLRPGKTPFVFSFQRRFFYFKWHT
jgi:hypothetical protein